MHASGPPVINKSENQTSFPFVLFATETFDDGSRLNNSQNHTYVLSATESFNKAWLANATTVQGKISIKPSLMPSGTNNSHQTSIPRPNCSFLQSTANATAIEGEIPPTNTTNLQINNARNRY